MMHAVIVVRSAYEAKHENERRDPYTVSVEFAYVLFFLIYLPAA